MSEHPIAKTIIEYIQATGGWYESFAHEHVRTSEEAAALRSNYSLKEGAKALIIRVKVKGEGKKFIMVVIPGDKKFDSAKVKKAAYANDLRFATEQEVAEITAGVKPGGVPPFGNLFGLSVLCDSEVTKQPKIIFNAGRNYSIAMNSQDYVDLVKPTVCDIC